MVFEVGWWEVLEIEEKLVEVVKGFGGDALGASGSEEGRGLFEELGGVFEVFGELFGGDCGLFEVLKAGFGVFEKDEAFGGMFGRERVVERKGFEDFGEELGLSEFVGGSE